VHVLVIAQAKGGVGKSTLAIHLAAEATRKKRRTVLLELDDGEHIGTASLWSQTRAERAAENDSGFLKSVDKPKLQPDVMRVEPHRLDAALATLKSKGVQLVVIDLPGTGSLAVNPAISAADLVLLPSRPQGVDLAISGTTVEVVHRADRPYAYVLTMVPTDRGHEAQDTTDELEAEGHLVAPQTIRQSKTFYRAIEDGSTVQEDDPTGKPAGDIRGLWKWIDQQLGEHHHEQRSQRASGERSPRRSNVDPVK
jgi:chromosome partitioning protein